MNIIIIDPFITKFGNIELNLFWNSPNNPNYSSLLTQEDLTQLFKQLANKNHRYILIF